MSELLQQLADELPQRAQITDSRLSTWIAGVQGLPTGQPPEWHMRRLAGWGGSEIGCLVGEELGIFDPFTTPKELVRQKLMLDLPEGSTPKMRRGQLMEPVIAQMFREKYGATPLPDLQQAINGARDPAHPWAASSLDDVVVIGGWRYIVDYKSPDTPPSSVPFHYYSQLNHYDAAARSIGESIDGLILCSLDYKRGETAELNVEQDVGLQDLMKSVGDRYWAMVVRGEEPEFVMRDPPEPMEFVESRIQQLRDLEEKYLASILIGKCHEETAAGLRSAICNLLNDTSDGPLKGFKAPTRSVKMQIAEKLDMEAIDEALRKRGADPADLREPQPGKFDTTALVEYVRDQGGDPDAFLQQVVNKDRARLAIVDLGLPLASYIKETITLKMPTVTSKAGKALQPRRDSASILADGASEAFVSITEELEAVQKAVTSPSPR